MLIGRLLTLPPVRIAGMQTDWPASILLHIQLCPAFAPLRYETQLQMFGGGGLGGSGDGGGGGGGGGEAAKEALTGDGQVAAAA